MATSSTLAAWTMERDAAVARDRAVLWFGLDTSLQLPSEIRALGACSPEDLRRLATTQRRTARGESRFRGVSWNAALESWRAWIRVDGEITRAEGFAAEEEAALAHDRLAIGLGAERSRLNFPDGPQEPITLDALRKELRARRKGDGATRNFPDRPVVPTAPADLEIERKSDVAGFHQTRWARDSSRQLRRRARRRDRP